MIQVQIATRLTPTDVAEVRWVLVDPSDLPEPRAIGAAFAPATAHAATAAPAHAAAVAPRWWVRPLQVIVLASAFGCAWWVADRMIGGPQAGVAPAAGRAAG